MTEKRKKRMSRKWFVMTSIFSITILCAAGALLFGVDKLKRQYAEEEYQIISSQVYDMMVSAMNKPIVISQAMASDVFLRDIIKNSDQYTDSELEKLLSEYLTELKETMHAQTAFVISDITKKYYTQEGLNKVIDTNQDTHDIWYSIFLNSRKPYDLDVDMDQVNGNIWTVFINARLEDANGKLLGVCGIGFAMNELQELLKDVETTYDVKVNFVDSEGLVQVDTDMTNIENAYLYDVQYGKEKDGYAYRNESGEYVVMRYVESLNWYLVLHGAGVSLTSREVMPIVIIGLLLFGMNYVTAYILAGRKRR